MSTVLINGRTAVHKGSNGTLSTIDVCLTKVGKHTVPIPYPNVAQSKDADKTAGTVFIEGNPVCHKKSVFAKSRGDEPGNKKGIKSGKKGAEASFIMGSNNVFIEGEPAVRALDMMVSNAKNTPPMPLVQAMEIPPIAKSASDEDVADQEVTAFVVEVAVSGAPESAQDSIVSIDDETQMTARMKPVITAEH